MLRFDISRIITTLLALAGLAFSACQRPPAPPVTGKFVDVNGYRLFINCTGEGSPTVILDAGLGGSSGMDWNLVQPEASKITRVCSYDRAGRGYSEKGPEPRTSELIVTELHTLLNNAGIQGPYVLAGYSFGGMNMRLYASRYPNDVVGMVLVDSILEDQDNGLKSVLSADEFNSYYAARVKAAMQAEQVDDVTSFEQLRAANWHADIPLVVIRHGRSGSVPFMPQSLPAQKIDAVEEVWKELQINLAKRSPQGTLVVAEKSNHDIPHIQPELIVNAIQKVVDAVRQK